MSYRDLDMTVHMQEVLNDERAIVVVCPPTYTAGYEKFFDTKGRLEWKEPEYGIFDADNGLKDMFEQIKGAKALVIVYEERATGDCIGEPIYGRDAGRDGMCMYLASNRPEEAIRLAKGKERERKAGVKMSPLKFPKSLHRNSASCSRSLRNQWAQVFLPEKNGAYGKNNQ